MALKRAAVATKISGKVSIAVANARKSEGEDERKRGSASAFTVHLANLVAFAHVSDLCSCSETCVNADVVGGQSE